MDIQGYGNQHPEGKAGHEQPERHGPQSIPDGEMDIGYDLAK